MRVRVTTTPRSAQLKLDGARVANPLDASVVKSGEHVLEARASGFEPGSRKATFDRNQVIEITLARLPPAAPVPSTSPKKRTTTTSPRPSSKASRPSSAPMRPSATPKKGAGFVADSPY